MDSCAKGDSSLLHKALPSCTAKWLVGTSGNKACLCSVLWDPFIICWVKPGFLCSGKQGKPWEFITQNLISREKNRGLCVEACWTTHSCNSFPTLSTSGTVTHFAACSQQAGTFICWTGSGWSAASLCWRPAVAPLGSCASALGSRLAEAGAKLPVRLNLLFCKRI